MNGVTASAHPLHEGDACATSAELAMRAENRLLRAAVAELDQRNHDLAAANARLEEGCRRGTEFISSMTHELRTPLNAILGFSEILRDGIGEYDEATRFECLDRIHVAGSHLLELVNNLLDVSKIEAGRMDLAVEEVELARVVTESASVVSALVQQRNQRLHVSCPPLTLRADPFRVKQILLNLLSNAIKFTPEGGDIWVVAASAGGAVSIDVADSGCGIAEADRERVFDRYAQVGGDSKLGTGLGLPIARQLAELHGGSLIVRGGAAGGSVFTLTLPATPSGYSLERRPAGL